MGYGFRGVKLLTIVLAAPMLVVGSLAAQTPPLIRTSGLGYDGAIVQRTQTRDRIGISWTPTADLVREAETLLPKYLESSAAASKLRNTAIRSQLALYKRQYWGLSSGNRRVMQIHFFHEKTPVVQEGRWLKSVVSVMGGGDRYFHVTYESERRSFTGLWVNAPE
jgi:hypothetical protein